MNLYPKDPVSYENWSGLLSDVPEGYTLHTPALFIPEGFYIPPEIPYLIRWLDLLNTGCAWSYKLRDQVRRDRFGRLWYEISGSDWTFDDTWFASQRTEDVFAFYIPEHGITLVREDKGNAQVLYTIDKEPEWEGEPR